MMLGTPLIKNRETGEVNNSNGETTTITEQEERSIVENISFDPIYFNEKPISEGQANLRYPLDKIPELGYDHVTFTAYNYQAGSLISSTGEERVGGIPSLKSVYLSFPTSKRVMVLNGVRTR